MNEQNVEMWEKIREVNDGQIRDFIAFEKNRLGDLLRGFTISWYQTEMEYHLELFSEGSQKPIADHPFPFGKGFRLGSIPKLIDGCDTLIHMQQAGRAFYFLWKKEIENLKRDLGKTG